MIDEFFLTGIFQEVSDGFARPLDIGRSMRPPALLIGLRRRDPVRQPHNPVVMQSSPLGQLSDPNTLKLDPSPLAPPPVMTHKLRNMPWTPFIVLRVRSCTERHTMPDSAIIDGLLNAFASSDKNATQPGQPAAPILRVFYVNSVHLLLKPDKPKLPD